MSIWKELGPTVIPNSQTIRSYTENDVRVNVTGRITAIVIHPRSPSVIYVGTAQGGVWKTTNGGIDWTPTSDNELSLAIGALAMDPSNPEVLYAGTGEGNIGGDSMYGLGVLKTTNGGQTWELKAKGTFSNDRFFRIAVHPSNSNYIFAATRSGIYRSTDAGESWSRLTYDLPSGSKGTDIVLDPKNPDTAYAAFWSEYRSGIYRTKMQTPQLHLGRVWRWWLVDHLIVAELLLGYRHHRHRDFMHSWQIEVMILTCFIIPGNGGESWTPIQLPDTTLFGHLYPQCIGTNGSYNLDVAVNPKNPDIVYLLGILSGKQ